MTNNLSLPSNIWTNLEVQSDKYIAGHLFKYRAFFRHKLDRQSRVKTKPNLRRTVCTAAYTACYIDSGPHRAEMPKRSRSRSRSRGSRRRRSSSGGRRRRRRRESGGESGSKNGQNNSREPEKRTLSKRSRFLKNGVDRS